MFNYIVYLLTDFIVPNIPSSPRQSRRHEKDVSYYHSSSASYNRLQHENEQRQTGINASTQTPIFSPTAYHLSEYQQSRVLNQTESGLSPRLCPDLLCALKNIQFLANHVKQSLEYQQV